MTGYVLVVGMDSVGLEEASLYLNPQNQMGCIHLHGLVYGYDFISHSSGYYRW